MVVKKKTSSSIDSFIGKGADVKEAKYSDFKNILIRIPIAILNAVDEQLKEKPWINRTHWIVEAIFDKLTEEANEEKENTRRRD